MELRHGYTLADLNHLARAAVTADRLMASDTKDRYDTAWSAIALQLYEAGEPPHWQALVRVGWQAIYQRVRDGQRQRGYQEGHDHYASSTPTMPRFVQFWGPGVTPSHEDRIVEKIATRQAMAAVTNPIYRDAVLALAAHDDYQAAATALGIKYSTLTVRLSVVRRAFLAAWYGDETPHRPRRTDRRVEAHGVEKDTRCAAGHEWTPENTRERHRTVRGKTKHERVCRACERDRGLQRRLPPTAEARVSTCGEAA